MYNTNFEKVIIMANVQTYYVSTQGNVKLSTNFVVKEFACKDGTDKVLIDLDLVNVLQKIRDKLGVSITINSGYRTKSHNANVNGDPNSLHLQGRAADIVAAGKTTLEIAACAESVGAHGILRYITNGFVHVDTRDNPGFYNVTNGAFTRVNSFGNSNNPSTISAIQTTLNSRYDTGLAVDGIYGANTKRGMIKGLQTELNKQYNAGLAVDGYWGAKTKAACPIIYGGSGNIQYIIQAGLYCIAGFTSLAVDGAYGVNTINAVKSFQAKKGLSSVDGRTGPDTFAALFG